MARTTSNDKDVYVRLMLVHTDLAITASVTAPIGNIANTTVYTLDAEFRPIEAAQCVHGSGATAGQDTIDPNETVVVRDIADINTNDTVNITARLLRS